MAQGPAIQKGSVEAGGNLAEIKERSVEASSLFPEMLRELRVIRAAIVALACDGGRYKESDFTTEGEGDGTTG